MGRPTPRSTRSLLRTSGLSTPSSKARALADSAAPDSDPEDSDAEPAPAFLTGNRQAILGLRLFESRSRWTGQANRLPHLPAPIHPIRNTPIRKVDRAG